ncbi:conserved hypothetical protein [Trichinella spiralis]|uniref:hypothetical protein n=1 Tax=Trichinella spiralis TaxID=6334 RepID=UPI0001EFC678|nr:conserved hypothetical protein [Trichinella spiralis]
MERLVSSVKVLYRKFFGCCRAKPDELRMLLYDVEAKKNDRQLTIVSDRSDDQLLLASAHLGGGVPRHIAGKLFNYMYTTASILRVENAEYDAPMGIYFYSQWKDMEQMHAYI